MSLELRVKDLAERAATVIKNIAVKQGDLTTLTTTNKDTLVKAINELKLFIDAIDLTDLIDDSLTTAVDKTYSIDKIKSEINDAIASLINGADVDNDTLKELADKIVALAQADNGLVSAVDVQAFSDTEKDQARDNISAAKKENLETLETNVGDTDHNFVTDFDNVYNA